MLHCVYHPVDEMRVVEDEEKAALLKTGVWFDHPLKALEYRLKVEKDMLDEGVVKTQEKEAKKSRTTKGEKI